MERKLKIQTFVEVSLTGTSVLVPLNNNLPQYSPVLRNKATYFCHKSLVFVFTLCFRLHVFVGIEERWGKEYRQKKGGRRDIMED